MEDALVFRVHALQRMFKRGIGVDDVKEAVRSGQMIEHYPDDKPFPSRLLLAHVRGRAIHVVTATDVEGNQTIVVTV